MPNPAEVTSDGLRFRLRKQTRPLRIRFSLMGSNRETTLSSPSFLDAAPPAPTTAQEKLPANRKVVRLEVHPNRIEIERVFDYRQSSSPGSSTTETVLTSLDKPSSRCPINSCR